MSFENETFRKAAGDAGIKPHLEDHRGQKALKHFSEYYHNNWPKWEREQDGYNGVLRKAQTWWANNKHKYS